MLYYTSPLKLPAWTVTIVADVRNFSIVISKRLLKLPDWRYTMIQCHISCMCVIFWNVYFHMCSQIACLKRCKVAIVACVSFSQMWIFTCATNRLLEQMKSHNSCRCAKFLHYDFQIACLNRCKVTLVACERFSEMFVFTCLLTSPAWKDAKSH